MALKTIRTSILLDKEDLDFLQELGIFKNNSDGIRWCIKSVCQDLWDTSSKSHQRKGKLVEVLIITNLKKSTKPFKPSVKDLENTMHKRKPAFDMIDRLNW